ncbi:hypothetical protein BGZ83_002036, partial [Gryganskiella cystojenkinii]
LARDDLRPKPLYSNTTKAAVTAPTVGPAGPTVSGVTATLRSGNSTVGSIAIAVFRDGARESTRKTRDHPDKRRVEDAFEASSWTNRPSLIHGMSMSLMLSSRS